ncbi:MAG TPA: tetratricopeptide repeat protein [Stellaceae bacterium]
MGALAKKKRGALSWAGRIFGLVLAAILLAGVAGSSRSLAQTQTLSGEQRTALEKRKEALFRQMLANPANLDATFAYADVSARLGDYEAAVSALERMLLFNPNLPRVQLELGALYFRMGSFDLARDYFSKAAAANPPPEVRQRIDEYLAQIDRAQSRHHFSGYLFFGGQYQTDANVAPGSPLIASPIGPVLLNSQFTRQASGSIFGSGAALYSYDLENQNRDTIDVSAVGAMNHYFNPVVHRLDLGLLELTAGPRFNFPQLGGNPDRPPSFRPYGIFDEVGLGWNQYFSAGGFGLEYDELVWRDLAVKSLFEYRRKTFANAPSRPLSTGLNGADALVSLAVTKPVTANSALNLEFDYLNQATALPYYSNNSYSVSGFYQIGYEAPFKLTPYPWQSTAFLGRVWSIYQAPDPCCSTSGNPLIFSPSSQLTQRWRFGVTQTFPVTSRIAIVFQAERDIVSSNLPLYAYTNTSVLLGPQIHF